MLGEKVVAELASDETKIKVHQPRMSRKGNVEAGVIYFTASYREGLLRAGFPCAKMQMLEPSIQF